MRNRGWIVLGLLIILFAGALVYGLQAGDAWYVVRNAQDFCFT